MPRVPVGQAFSQPSQPHQLTAKPLSFHHLRTPPLPQFEFFVRTQPKIRREVRWAIGRGDRGLESC